MGGRGRRWTDCLFYSWMEEAHLIMEEDSRTKLMYMVLLLPMFCCLIMQWCLAGGYCFALEKWVNLIAKRLPHLCAILFSCWKVSQAPKSGDGPGWVRLVQCLVFCSVAERFGKLCRMDDGTGWVRVVQCLVFCSVAERICKLWRMGDGTGWVRVV